MVLIHWLLGGVQRKAVTPLELSKQLNYSAMTITRAGDELEVSKVAHIEQIKCERLISFS